MTLEIHELDQSIIMTALKGGLLKNAFLFMLGKKNPKGFTKILARAKKYANIKKVWSWKGESPNDKRIRKMMETRI